MKANYFYDHYAYSEAIPYYEKLDEKSHDAVSLARLGDCYRLTNELEKASDAYSKAVKKKGLKDPVLLRYGLVLMQQMKYAEAAKWFGEYQKKAKKDVRIINLIAGCESAPGILQAMPPGTALFQSFNTYGSDFAPTLWNGKLVFSSDTSIDVKKKTDKWTGRSYYNMYSVQCDAKGNCANELNKVTESKNIDIKYHDGPCTFSADGKEMYFTRSKYMEKLLSNTSVANSNDVVLLEIMVATDYDTAKKQFKKIKPFAHNSEQYSVAHPAVSPDGKMLIFSSDMPQKKNPGMGSDLYVCNRDDKGGWSSPINIGKTINTEGEELFPYFANEKTLYFSSDGHKGLGGLDIYKAEWNPQTKSFSNPVNAGIPLNSSYDDISLALFADGRSSYFSSNRPAAKGGDNIYYYKKEKLFLQLNVIDSITREPLTGVQLKINSVKETKNTEVDGKGQYYSQLYPEAVYDLALSKEGYTGAGLSVTATTDKEVDTLVRTAVLFNLALLKRDTIPAVPVATDFTKVVGVPEVNKVYEIGHFYFAYNKADLNDAAKKCLDDLVAFLRPQPTMRIQVRSHTDCRGGAAYNQKLSKQRANVVVQYLIQNGIDAKRLEYVGLGSSMPKIPCKCAECSEEQHYENRVLEFKILKL